MPEKKTARKETEMPRKQPTPLTANDLIAVGVGSLAPGARWCVLHAEGPLLDTASLDFTYPIRLACSALKCDWDHLQESGFWLGQVDADGKPVPAWDRNQTPPDQG